MPTMEKVMENLSLTLSLIPGGEPGGGEGGGGEGGSWGRREQGSGAEGGLGPTKGLPSSPLPGLRCRPGGCSSMSWGGRSEPFWQEPLSGPPGVPAGLKRGAQADSAGRRSLERPAGREAGGLPDATATPSYPAFRLGSRERSLVPESLAILASGLTSPIQGTGQPRLD